MSGIELGTSGLRVRRANNLPLQYPIAIRLLLGVSLRPIASAHAQVYHYFSSAIIAHQGFSTFPS